MLKVPYHRDKKLRESARGMPCMAGFPGCNHNAETVVWCHSNQSIHGKGGSLKAHDCFGFYGCSACNEPDPRLRAVREDAENKAMRATRYLMILRRIVVGADTQDARSDARWLEGWQIGRIRMA